MIIDVSHLSDTGFYDVLAHTKKPFVASHSNARSLCASPRNLTDDMIRKLAERGGIAGINFYQHFLGEQNADESYLDLAVQHMKYMINLGGERFRCPWFRFPTESTATMTFQIAAFFQNWFRQ